MSLLKDFDQKDSEALGQELHRFTRELYPICRSITGEGLRRTLAMIRDQIPLQLIGLSPKSGISVMPSSKPPTGTA
jgi:aminopeptidase-like protein